MATIPSVQLFRNSIIKTGRQAAIDALEAQKASVADGGLILARYSEDGTDNGVKTLLGIVRNGGGTNVQLTIIDVEGAAKNVQSAITSAINKLNTEDNAVDGQYVSSVSEDKGIITVTRQELPSFDEKSNSGKAITAITQTKGLVDVKFGGVAAANVSVEDSIGKFDSDNVEGALLEIKTSLDNAIGAGGTVEEQISAKINALNSEESGTSTSNHITVGVKQAAGKITSVTVSDSDIASAELLGKISDTKDKATAFGRIAQEVADREAAIGALSTSSTVTLESAAGTESGVLKVYTIKQGGEEVGKINIPKDLVVTSGSVVKGNWNDGVFTENVSGSGTALKLVIANQEAPVYINTLDLVKDHTAGSGIAISETNVISVVRDTDSENFLTVSESGVKLSGVQDAISEASGHVNSIIEARLGTGVTSNSTATAQFAELSSKLGTGVTTVATETVTAQLQALSGSSTSDTSDTISVIGAKKYTDAKVEALDLDSVGGIGQVITTISQTDGRVSATAINLTANNVKATASTGVPTAVDVTGETVSEQIASLAKSIKSVSTAAAAAHTVVNAKAEGHVTVSIAKSEDDSHDVVTITENDIASANDLSAEVSNRETADTTLQTNINNVKSSLESHTADTVVHITQAERKKWNTPTDLSDYYTKAEVDNELSNYYTKTEVDNDLSNYYTKTEIDTELLKYWDIDTTGRYVDATVVEELGKLNADVESTTESTTETTTTKAIRIKQANGIIESITLGAFDCGTY